MCGAPSIVPVVAYEALIAPVSYVQWLLGDVGASVSPTGRGVSIVEVRSPPQPASGLSGLPLEL